MQYAAPSTPARTSGLAITGLVCGVLGFVTFGLLGIVGLILSIVAQRSISGSDGRLGGRGIATAGIIVSSTSLLAGCVIGGLIGLLLPAVGQARIAAKSVSDMSRLRDLGTTVAIYAAENQGRYVPVETWDQVLIDAEIVIDERLYTSTFAPNDGRAFAMNEDLDGLRDEDVTDPATTVLMFECAIGSPAAGGPELFAPDPRHRAGYLVLFADGSVDQVAREDIALLTWSPGGE
ncbi:MAG: DUF4190 domain-containing protein [Planctomycetes bacterium]|nr:DUF4190 domain-containing protein [Planctomycetota bacterium]